MSELLSISFSGAGLIPTVLLCLIILYWIITIIGFLDFDFFDFDGDVEVESLTESVANVINFFHVSGLPASVFLSFTILFYWITYVITATILIPSVLLSFVLLIPELIVSLFIVKLVMTPLKKFFPKEAKQSRSDLIIGKLCTLKFDLKNGKLSQAEVDSSNESAGMVVNVKPLNNDEFIKGEKALIIEKTEGEPVYLIDKFTDF